MNTTGNPFALFFFLALFFTALSPAFVDAQVHDNCEDYRVYGNDTDSNYIRFRSGGNTRIIYFNEVTVSKTGDAGYLVCFPVFGIAPVTVENESVEPAGLLRLISAEDFDNGMSQLNLLISPGSEEPYYFTRSSLSTIDCVLDNNRYNPSLEDLRDPVKSNMDHDLREDKDKLIIDYNSVSKEDTTFSMEMHVEAKTESIRELKDNFRAEIAGDTMMTRIFLYREAGFLTYETRYGLEKTVPLPEDGAKRSGTIEKDFAQVFEFKKLTGNQVSFHIHNVQRTSGDKYKRAIMNPLESAGTTLDDFTLNSNTYKNTIVAAELVTIKGDPVLIDQNALPEQEQFYAYPIRLDMLDREIGLKDLPGEQSFPLDTDLQAFSYSLVDPNLRTVEVNVSETPDQFFIDIRRGSLEQLETEIEFQRFLEVTGEYADPVMGFIVSAAEDYEEMGEKDISWWEAQLTAMGVVIPDSDNPRDYLMAIENTYSLSSSVVRTVAEYYYEENYEDLKSVYTTIFRMKSDRADTSGYADQVGEMASRLELSGMNRQGWFNMVVALEDSLRILYPENAISWALKTTGAENDPVTRFTFATDKYGKIRKAEFLAPSGYKALKFTYCHDDDSVRLGISHPRQESDHRTCPVDRGIPDIHYLFPLLSWYDYTGDRDSDYYFMNLKGTTYGRNFYITPVFYQVSLRLNGEERIDHVNREIDTYKVVLTFNVVPERPAILFSEFSGTGSGQPVVEVWMSQDKPHVPVRIKIGSRKYLLGPASGDPEQASEWFDWYKEKSVKRQ